MKKLKKLSIREYMENGNGKSSIRLIMVWSMILATFVIVGMVFVFIYNTIMVQPVEWSNMAVFMGALTAFIGATIWGKVQQKKSENGNGNGHHTNEYNNENEDEYDYYNKPKPRIKPRPNIPVIEPPDVTEVTESDPLAEPSEEDMIKNGPLNKELG